MPLLHTLVWLFADLTGLGTRPMANTLRREAEVVWMVRGEVEGERRSRITPCHPRPAWILLPVAGDVEEEDEEVIEDAEALLRRRRRRSKRHCRHLRCAAIGRFVCIGLTMV